MQVDLFYTNNTKTLESHTLTGGFEFISGQIPPVLREQLDFINLWNLHPDDFHIIMMHGKEVATPRWQQAYGHDYFYTGKLNKALPIPKMLLPVLHWCQEEIDSRLNGILLNWYDANEKHYIGRHRDKVKGMYPDSPIVTISLGAERFFRLRPWKEEGKIDFKAADGTVFVMPAATNQAFTHEVPHTSKSKGRRISITLRAFE